MNDNRLVAWKTFDLEGRFTGVVFASNALEAISQVPAHHSVYVGGPSPEQADRPYWFEAWQAGTIDPDELLGNDPRHADE